MFGLKSNEELEAIPETDPDDADPQYRTLLLPKKELNDAEAAEKLNRLSADGWRVITAVDSPEYMITFVLERPKPEPSTGGDADTDE